MRLIACLCACACVLGLAGATGAQTRVAFLAAGDYGVGGSAELSLGRAMQRYETRQPGGHARHPRRQRLHGEPGSLPRELACGFRLGA